MDLPQPPQDPELKTVIDKLAQFVARNGPQFEAVTKTNQKGNPKFSFLFGGEFYNYYTYKVITEQAILRQKGQQQQQHHINSSSYPQNDWNQPQMQDGWSNSYQQPHPQTQISQSMQRPYVDQQFRESGNDRFQLPRATYTTAEVEKLKDQLSEVKQQVNTLEEQVRQSETNLAAQKQVTEAEIKQSALSTIQKAKREHLELLAEDTGIDLQEVDNVMSPIIDNCTKDSISTGKGWIFANAINHDNNQLIANYLGFRVTSEGSPFSLKLHLIYLMNDVVHHCLRKGNEELKLSLESVAVEMFCSAWVAAGQDSEQSKLTKLIRLWEEKSIFSHSTLNKMRNPHESWENYKEQLRVSYESSIERNAKTFIDTYNSFEKQHDAFVAHARSTIKNLETQVRALESNIKEAEESFKPDDPLPKSDQDWGQSKRSSRWDTGHDGSYQQQASWGEQQHYPNQGFDGAPPGFVQGRNLPDLSRPPPGFSCPPPGFGPPPSVMPMYDEKKLIPLLPYYELPAGLMVPLVPFDKSGYKPLDPSKLRLPPPVPPPQSIITALEQFYSPPSHDRPRDQDGWEIMGLYEWSRRKTAAVKAKNDAVDSGEREKSPPFSSEDYDSDSSAQGGRKMSFSEPQREAKRKRYRSKSRSQTRSRSRSRTRSRSRDSTPDFGNARKRESRSPPSARNRRNRSNSRSPSPTGSYSLPSYLKSRRDRRESRSASRSPPRNRSRDRRSPSPEASEYVGFGAVKKLDSSNKGHMMMQKMGWKGSGLGQGEVGIVEPISGGDVRDKSDMYRGVGAGGGGSDPFEAFRKSKAGSFYTRMKDREKDRHSDKKVDKK